MAHIFDCGKCGKPVQLEGERLDHVLNIAHCWVFRCDDCADEYCTTHPDPEPTPEPPKLTFAEWDKQIAQQYAR